MSVATASKGVTVSPSLDAGRVLSSLPQGLREPLIKAFGEIVVNYGQRRWEPAELNGGKLCEVVHTVLRGIADGEFASAPAKTSNMVDACRAMEKESSQLPRSVRIQIPRMLMALYEVRNNRGVGHVGGDVEPNHMDAVAVLYISKWIMAELVRLLHSVETDAATALVDALVEREVPIVWKVGSKMRVLSPGLSRRDTALLLLHAAAGPVAENDLRSWVEHPNAANFRRDVLRPLHAGRLIEYDDGAGTVQLSPSGARRVEECLPTELE